MQAELAFADLASDSLIKFGQSELINRADRGGRPTQQPLSKNQSLFVQYENNIADARLLNEITDLSPTCNDAKNAFFTWFCSFPAGSFVCR